MTEMATQQEELKGLPWRVYMLNDCDWWVARSLPEAMGDYLLETGMSASEAFDGQHELSDADLDRLIMRDCDEDERPTGWTPTFREYLAKMVADGLSEPGMFASTEA